MMEFMSIKQDNALAAAPTNLNDRIARRVRALRDARGLSLEALAAHCGVSRSMISLVERGESSPTAVLLEKLATGLEVPLASLFDSPAPEADPVSRRADQPVWRDPGSGYLRRNISPAGVSSPLQIVEVSFPAGARVAYETAARTPVIHQQVWVLQGVIDITLGNTRHRLGEGDCLAHRLDQPMVYANPMRRRARYAVLITTDPAGRR
jgi:transcriptional regulator with XRE-family HTH domain